METMLNTLEDRRCEAQMFDIALKVKWLRVAATEVLDELEVLDEANKIMFQTLEK